jgi:ribosomal protein S18 acetylase RimI-like enzyme
MDTRLRRATPADTERVVDIARRNFTETFGHLYPAEDLAYFLDHAYSLDAHRALLADDACAVWLLERGERVLGHAVVGPCGLPHPDVQPGDGELKRLYLLKDAQNGGWGGRMLSTALEWLERDGPRTLWIGVWSENLGAQRLYARHGFEKVGEYLFPVGATSDREFILRRAAARRDRGG